MKKLIIPLLGVLLLLTSCTTGNTKTQADSKAEVETISKDNDNEGKTDNKEVTKFEFTDFDGKIVSEKDFEGKKVYIKFWASWCSICLKTLAETDELSAMDNDFEVITVVAPNFSGEKDSEDFKKWYNNLGYQNITVLLDLDGKYMKEFGVRAFPTSAYIDSDGSLIGTTVGHSSIDKIKEMFQ